VVREERPIGLGCHTRARAREAAEYALGLLDIGLRDQRHGFSLERVDSATMVTGGPKFVN